MTWLHYTINELHRFILNQIKIKFNLIPDDCIIVKHSSNTADIDKGKYSSWTKWWEDTIKLPLEPPSNICPCCQRTIINNRHNYFVVGHIYDIRSSKKYVCPVCNQCNTGMKKWKFLVPKALVHSRPKL